MIRRWLLLLALFTAAPALADGLLKKPPTTLDPAKAYVVVEIGRLDGALLFGTLTLARYDTEKQDIAVATPPPGGKIPKGGWPLDNRLILNKASVKEKNRQLFYVEMQPGLWVVEGANDTSFALGSSTFELAPGSVTDLGVANVYTDFPEGEKRDVLTTGRLMKGALMGGLFGSVVPKPMPRAVDFRARTATDMPVPAVFAAAAPVAWTGQVEFGNHLGGLVNRMGGIKSRPGQGSASPSPVTGESAAPAPPAN